jgi:Leucine-rich repeat (LRR) protein
MSDILGYFVPDAILDQIFSTFLSLDDVSRCDMAICNQKKRLLFLKCLRSCIWNGNKDQDFSCNGISWIQSRSIKVRHLKCKQITLDMSVKISSFGGCLHWLSIQDKQDTPYNIYKDNCVSKIILGCPNLQYLNLSSLKITDVSIISFCPNLKELNLSGNSCITDSSIIRIAEACQMLQKLDLSGNHRITDAGIDMIAEKCPMLQELNLYSNRCLTDDSIVRIAQKCPMLQKLDLSGNHLVTDDGIVRIADALPMLRILDLSGCYNITDVSVRICHSILYIISRFLFIHTPS